MLRVLASTETPQSQALILVIACALPDFNRMTANEDLGWAIYLVANEAMKALMCLAFVRNIAGVAGFLWFVTQAIDEATGRNVWPSDSPLEYIAFAVLWVAVLVYLKLKR